MLLVVLAVLALALALALVGRRTEGFFGGALPPGACRQRVLDVEGLSEAVGLGVDVGIPLRPGKLTPAYFSASEVREAMACGVALIDKRCRLDLALVGVSGGGKATDGLGATQYTGDAHVYSQRFNSSSTLRLEVLAGGGRRYLRAASTLTGKDDGRGVDAAPPDVFSRQHDRFESLV